MLQISSATQTELRCGLRQLRDEIAELGEFLAVRGRERACGNIKYQLAAARFQITLIRHAYACRKAGFNPDQPRVPRGNPDGGQWTAEGGDEMPATTVRTRSPNDAGSESSITSVDGVSISDSRVISDASPDPMVPGAQYAQTRINIETSALTGIQRIDDTTMKLANTLARVKDVVDYAPNLGPAVYGTEVHTAFAAALRLQQLPGVDVEPTFGGDYYGATGSLRPDAVLRNDIGDVIAIYDVKTGEKGIDPIRAAKLRLSAGVGNEVPVIQLSIPYGVSRKYAALKNVFEALLRKK